jgi:hypothetical protein
MIRVDRGSPPAGFAGRAASWRRAYADEKRRRAGASPTEFWRRIRPRLREDAEALFQASHGKCAYCESRMAHVSRAQIDHYYPKASFPRRCFDWSNWLLSCGRCNDSKWASFPACDGEPCLVDPGSEDPAAHVEFRGAMAAYKSRRGEVTIDLVGLNRSPLEDERTRWLLQVEVLLLLCPRGHLPRRSAGAHHLGNAGRGPVCGHDQVLPARRRTRPGDGPRPGRDRRSAR